MRRLVRNFKQSVQLRLTSYFLIILIPLVAISVYAGFRSQRNLEVKVNEQILVTLASAVDSFDMMMQNIDMLSMSIADDDNIIDLLKLEDTRLTERLTLNFQKVLNQLSSTSAANGNLSQLAIYHSFSNTMISSQYGSRQVEGYQKQRWYLEVLGRGGKSILLLPREGEFDSYQQLDPAFHPGSVTLLRPVDPFGVKVTHVVMITVGRARLARELGKLVSGPEERAYLLAEDGRVLAGTASLEDLPEREDDSRMMTVGKSERTGKEELVVQYRSPQSGWSIVMVKPADAIYAESDKLRMITYAIIGVSFLLTLMISWVVYRGIAAPLSSLAHGMKQLRVGKLDTSLPGKREDEFGYLMNAFNQMAQEQKHLIENIYEQQLLRLKAELRVLQSQINPHFLYNTLDTMYSMAENYGADEIGEMALNLSKFFRLSLSKGQEEFTVGETVQHLQYYLRVQQLRFVDKLAVQVNVEEACKPIPVLKLLLQPLVENAILHGLEKKAKGGEVRIDIRLEGDMLRMEVADNGKGLDPERLEYIRSELGKLSIHAVKGLLQEQKPRTELYGLWNVKARLKLYYGDRAELEIDSRENEGTSVILWIPIGGAADESDDRGG
ncbi:cache domain-containing sensor histidine kinase [Paenibacillus flagellatus]|nr:sensor histidine kinase [Paenibacillus flagellatus]